MPTFRVVDPTTKDFGTYALRHSLPKKTSVYSVKAMNSLKHASASTSLVVPQNNTHFHSLLSTKYKPLPIHHKYA